jgi:hypothetical protein
MIYLHILRNTACRSALLLALPWLGGCQETLIFFEQTAFKLGISVNEEPPLPLEVTVGLKRRVVAISPPKKPLQTNAAGGRRADGEAVSLLSRFDVIYSPDETGAASPGNPFGGKLTIISAFASGGAAVTIAGDPVAMALVVDPGLLGNEVTRAMLAQEQRRDAMFRAIDTIAGDRARSLAMSPPTPIDPAMANVVAAVDPNGQRGVDDAAARRVLKAWVPELPVTDYATWEAALDVR